MMCFWIFLFGVNLANVAYCVSQGVIGGSIIAGPMAIWCAYKAITSANNKPS